MDSELGEMLLIVLVLAACIGFTGWSMKYIHRLKEEQHQPQPVEDPPQNRQPERQQEHVSTKSYIKVPTLRTSRSQLKHPENYTEEEILEAVARGFITPDDPAVTALKWTAARRSPSDVEDVAAHAAFANGDPNLRGDAHLDNQNLADDVDDLDLSDDFNIEPTDDLDDSEFDDDLRDDFDKDFEDPDLREDFSDSDLDDFDDDLDDADLDEGDWDREDAVMRAQANLRIMREEDQNYALDAIEAEVLNLDHEPDEDELVAIADRAADFYDMSEDYRDY